jgi:hypothetical protein
MSQLLKNLEQDVEGKYQSVEAGAEEERTRSEDNRGITRIEERRDVLRLVKDDYVLLQSKIHNILINISVPGSIQEELAYALSLTQETIPHTDTVTDDVLEAAVKKLVGMAYYARLCIDNSMIPGDMLEETSAVYMACKYLEKRWLDE